MLKGIFDHVDNESINMFEWALNAAYKDKSKSIVAYLLNNYHSLGLINLGMFFALQFIIIAIILYIGRVNITGYNLFHYAFINGDNILSLSSLKLLEKYFLIELIAYQIVVSPVLIDKLVFAPVFAHSRCQKGNMGYK